MLRPYPHCPPAAMSLKYFAQKEGPAHYVLPRTGSMRVEAHAFFSESLFERTEESMWQQLASAASYPGVVGAYLMPDAHAGYGVPVGCVVVTEDTILQAGSGYDISCGVLYMRVPKLHAADVADWDRRAQWISEVDKRVATGVGSGRPALMPRFSSKKGDEILRYGAKAIGVSADLCERQFIEVADDVNLEKITRAYDKVVPQLGSVGGGNHFIEMQVDRDDGSVWVMIHCGSRGYGWQTANYFFYEGARLRGLPTNRREDSWLRIDEPLGREYWAHHNTAANYAVANRHIIVRGVQEALASVFGAEGEVYYEISHNLVQRESLLLPDGTTKRGFVHRKGATRAFPAGHPDLVGTAWEKTGHPCLIPGSMFHGAAILFAEPGASRSGFSVNHGSGRHMARGAAKRELEASQHEIDHEMKSVVRELGGVKITGIVGNTKKTPLDECGRVYKNLDEVLSVLEAEGIARVAHRMYPVANMKGMD
ncbi:MAG: RtcB family protein [Polyangiaceae bacterium]|nr:RtcB family protein [Polyangiaceae bacterium]